MRYLLYARKSSESEDKQAQSIDDQLAELRRLAQQRNLHVVGELTEARSAKSPGSRPVFAELVSRLQDGQADAILCWHVNRLFRNPVDFGAVSWMLQTGALKEIHTPHQVHRSGDNVLLLSVESGMANQYILDLQKAVVRGLNSKVEKGWFPHKAPEGYLNRDGQIDRDPERSALVRRMWDLALSQRYSVPQILAQVQGWGYTTKKLKRTGGNALSRSTLYAMFSNLFYAGYFVRAGQTFRGAHPPMVTLAEFFQVQKHLKRQGRRQGKHDFAFNGLIRCGHCGGAVCGERKAVRLRSGGTNVHFYYSCANSRKTCQRKVVTEEAIEGQISRLLAELSVPPEFVAFAQQVIARWKDGALAGREAVKQKQAEAMAAMERRRGKLLEMKLNDLLSDAEYLREKDRVQEEIVLTRIHQQQGHEETDALWENVENAVTLLHYGQAFFEGGDAEMQHLIARTIGAQFVLTDRSLAIELSPAFGEVARLKSELGADMEAGGSSEPVPERENRAESGSQTQKDALNESMRLSWWGMLDALRTGLGASRALIPEIMPNKMSGPVVSRRGADG